MTLLKKEAPANWEGLDSSELVSAPPVFNMSRARMARLMVRAVGLDGFQALNLALALSVYNLPAPILSKSDMDFIKRRHFTLIGDEIAAAHPSNHLPTIGFEVESPRKPYRLVNSRDYVDFFDAIGMPRNRVNKFDDAGGRNPPSAFWEFSPPPSYSASVQARILHELITGRFIPSLRYSQDPEQIKTLLDNKLVSLHLNLGVPSIWMGDIVHLRGNEDAKILASMLALAYTSPVRLESRSQQVYVDVKDADPTVKGGGVNRRLELKALEVRDESVYRLMIGSQPLGGAMFARLGGYDQSLAEVWDGVREDGQKVYNRYRFEPDMLKSKQTVAELVRRYNIGQELRRIIEQGGIEARRRINQL